MSANDSHLGKEGVGSRFVLKSLLFTLMIAALVLGLDTPSGFQAQAAAHEIQQDLPTVRDNSSQSATESVAAAFPVAVQESLSDRDGEILTPRMRAVLEHVTRRYRVSSEALLPIFQAVQLSGLERGLDPLVIVAIIGIESSFNPFSESTKGALGLMQVIPRYHQDKLPAGTAQSQFLDPLVNVRIGSHVLDEYIRQQGSLIAGLQKFGGALNDEANLYANKVLAEKERLEQAARRGAASV